MKLLMVRTQTFGSLVAGVAAVVSLAAFLTAAPFHAALAQVAPTLGTAQSFAVLAGSTVTNTGATAVVGDLGVSPGTAVTGFPPGIVTGGTIHAADATALQAQSDTTTAYNSLAGESCNFDLTGQNLGGLTLVPGVYCFSSSAQLTGTLTLDAQSDPNAVWVFKIVSTLTTSNSSVLLINSAQQCNVFWQVGSSATLSTGTTFVGNILALTSITLTTNATVSGRALAQNGAVTMDSNTVTVSVCAPPPVTPIPPTLGKAFSPATINPAGGSTLTITLSNADATAASLTSPLTDTLPSGVVTTSTPTTTCGGTATATASTVTLTGGSIPANGACTVTVPVTAAAGGSYFNSLAAGALQTGSGNNAAQAIATLTVNTPSGGAPTLAKSFSPAAIHEGGNSTLTITLSNNSGTAASLTAPLTDTLPSGVTIASTPTTTCGGTVTSTTSTVTLTGGSIPANGACTVTIPVTAAAGGSYFNSLAAGALQTGNGNNAAPAIATLTVSPPASVALSKAFSPATISAGGNSTLTITLSNTSSGVAYLTAPLTDILPAGVTLSSTPGTTCHGLLTGHAGDSSVALTCGSIPARGSCTVTMKVTAPVAGSYFNSLAAGALQTGNGNNAAPGIATLTVIPAIAAPKLTKSFSPATISAGGTSTLTITLSNTNSSAANLTASLTDNLPCGVTIASTPTTTCGGTVKGTLGGSAVTLTGGSIPANGSCTATVKVSAKQKGSYCNKLSAGALQTDKGCNSSAADATLTVNKQ